MGTAVRGRGPVVGKPESAATLCAAQLLVHLAHHDTNHLGQFARIRGDITGRDESAATRMLEWSE